jgi:RHS repeat-associated protein
MSDERTHSVNGNIATDEVLWALTDRQGSVNDLAKVDTSGVTSVVDHIVRDSFGNVVSESNPSQGCLIGWTGRPVDKTTGLQNNLNRWYDSRVAGWLSQDPIGFKSGTTNLYCYCGNSPTNAVDPSGEAGYRVNCEAVWWNPFTWYERDPGIIELPPDPSANEGKPPMIGAPPERGTEAWNQQQYWANYYREQAAKKERISGLKPDPNDPTLQTFMRELGKTLNPGGGRQPIGYFPLPQPVPRPQYSPPPYAP